MKRSSRHSAAALLGLAVLCFAGLAAPVQASSPAHHHAHSCKARRCSRHTGGKPAKTHRTSVKAGKRSIPRQTSPNALDPSPSAPIAETVASKHHTAAEDAAAVIAAVLATPCADTEITPTAEDLPLLRASVLCLINHERAEHSLAPLATSQRLEDAAEEHCAELISSDYFAHVSPTGETPVDRIRKTGYIPGPDVGYVIGENLAWGTYGLSTPQSIVAAWIASPGHLANILEAQYTETGIGIVPAVPASLAGGDPGATYAQEFGVIIH